MTTGAAMQVEQDVRKILPVEGLARLREAWRRAPNALTNNARERIVLPYPPAGEGFNVLGDHAFKRVEGIAPKERERCIIAVLTSKDLESGFILPVHLYWGLMEGLDPADIAETLFLGAVYSGIANYLSGIGRFQSILRLLAELVRSGEDLSPVAVAARISQSFAYGNRSWRPEEREVKDAAAQVR